MTMATKTLIVSLFVVYLTTYVQSYQFQSEKLIEYLDINFNPDVIPKKSADKPVKVSVTMMLQDIRDFDYRRKEVELDSWMDLQWNSGITFTPADFDNVADVRFPSSKMWIPDLTVYNGESETGEYFNGKSLALVYADGKVLWVPQIKIRARCQSVENGNVTCTVKIGSWTYSSLHLTLDENTKIDVSTFFANSQFELLATSAKREVTSYECCPEAYESIVFTISFRKK